MWEGSLEGVRSLAEGCGKAVNRVLESCLEDVGNCLEGVGRLSRWCGKDV